MPNPISHAEMVAAVRRAIFEYDLEDLQGWEARERHGNALRAVLLHLERTQALANILQRRVGMGRMGDDYLYTVVIGYQKADERDKCFEALFGLLPPSPETP